MFSNKRVLGTKKFLLGVLFSVMLLPMMAFASSEFKGTETVNINKANAATLAAYLKGVGPNKAEAIVKYRRANGKFKTVADLKNVPGIGDETFKDVKRKVSTTRGKSTAPKGYKLGETSGKSKSTKKKSTKKSSSKASDSSKSSTSKSKAKKTKEKKTSTTKKKSSSKKSADKKSSSKTSKTKAKKKPSTKKSTSKKKTTKKKPAKKKSTKKKKKSS